MIVRWIQAVPPARLHELQQLGDSVFVGPGRCKIATLIKLGQRVTSRDYDAAYGKLSGLTQVLDLEPDRLAIRHVIGIRKRGRQPRHQQNHHLYNDQPMDHRRIARRRRRSHAVIGSLIACLTLPLGGAATVSIDERSLQFFHTHTGESLDIVYKRDGDYVPEALQEINAFLADFRTGAVADIDPELLDLIYDLREALDSTGTYEVISAYRSLATNEMLRRRSGGVARNSQHLLGKAIDVRLTDVELTRLRDTAIAMQRGGVGYYAAANFVHIDTGRVRRW